MGDIEKEEYRDDEEITKVRTNKNTGSLHFGDPDDVAEDEDKSLEDMNDATWKEVFNACCVHTPEE